ncbi:hypothetical protein CEXT_32621 [Caerostris extrusa]|uniref:Uncharacterized protein n=1 Tax=Caerostris extrusa TaxID=172846 RepID=A0AAV4SI22_CAEEX|nr:hypothetical protein CEXT_32621 [Caerostris extrusa]
MLWVPCLRISNYDKKCKYPKLEEETSWFQSFVSNNLPNSFLPYYKESNQFKQPSGAELSSSALICPRPAVPPQHKSIIDFRGL